MKKTLITIISAMLTMPAAFTAMAAGSDEPVSLTDLKPAKKKKVQIKEVVFHVHLHCENCVKKVQENIAFEKGVKDLKVSLEDQTVALKYDASKTSEAVLKAAIEKLGYEVK